MNKNKKLTDIQIVIMEILYCHVGKENRISRAGLLAELNNRGFAITDQSMRKNIEKLRLTETGAYICSTIRGGGGYWRAKSLDEVLEFLRQDERRAKSILYRISRQKKRSTRAMTMQTLTTK